MASLIAPRNRLPQSSLARRHKELLNPIIEEESDDGGGRQMMGGFTPARRAGAPAELDLTAMLSPMSDHFPTPRGIHYLAAPVLPSSPSTAGTSENSPTSSSNQWNRASVGSANTEFEDLYDVSDQEDDLPKGLQRAASSRRAEQRQPTRLVIPVNPPNCDDTWSARELKKLASPVPLTPSAQLTMSPAQLTFMDQQQALEIPTSSAPPSLDGSLTSEQLAAMSAPPTPVMDNDDDDAAPNERWTGVELQPGALATLQALSGNDDDDDQEYQPEQVLEVESPQQAQPVGEMRQQTLTLVTNFQTRSVTAPLPLSRSSSRQSLADLTKLEIPSPGGFFSGLSPRTRHTWHMPSKSPAELAPPTSTTAEQFYRCPWNRDSPAPPMPRAADMAENFYRTVSESDVPVERVVEIPDVEDEDDMPTARPILPKEAPAPEPKESPKSPEAEDAATEIVVQLDAGYARKQQKEALSNLDRTELWLSAQRAYLKAIDNQAEVSFGSGLRTVEEVSDEAEAKQPEAQEPQTQQVDIVRKKTVRFSDITLSTQVATTTTPVKLPMKLRRQESAYYRAFQSFVVRYHVRDAFVHQLPRFEALQAQRVSLPELHRSQLLGKYQLSVVPQSAKKRLSANVARDDHTLIDDPEKIKLEKEFEAMTQTTIAAWQVAAVKLLNGGKLISAPVAQRLARLSYMAPSKKHGVARDRARILDLGGQTTCDWAWHCALQFPNTKIYTVTTKAIRQLSNANIRGPSNHRQVAVERLTRLPFEDNQFDLISARELHSVLKYDGENGQDEWETCLRECMRVLKPGGYIDFSVMDSDIMNAGPLGLAKSVEFGFTLKTLGYDPSPSKMWLGRLARAGFTNVRRAWTCLPMGPKQNPFRAPTPPMKDGPLGETGKTCQMEATVMGSSNQIAGACSVVGCWSWERWILRCEMEKVAGELRLADTVTSGAAMKEAGKALDGVHAVIEEGRNCNAAFRMLSGYAQKPQQGTEMINIALAE